jgi:hypothetical protein
MEKKKITVQTAFDNTIDHMRRNKDDHAFREFQNRMRQGMTEKWKHEYGSTKIEYKDGYIHDLERELFDLLNTK